MIDADIIIPGDCREVLANLPRKSIDLVFADPPYNIQHKAGELKRADGRGAFESVEEEWDKFSSFAEYEQFTREWLEACRGVMTDDATIWVMGSFHNIYLVGYTMLKMGFWILNDPLWIKANPAPNWSGRRFCHAHETLIWAKQSEKQKRYTFNYHELKKLNGGKQMRDDWYFPVCAGKERLKGDDGRKLHSTQKPEALLERVILAASRPGDIVLDPFFGTGTTGAVAKRLGRHFVGIEKDETYIIEAAKRCAAVESPLVGREADVLVLDDPYPGDSVMDRLTDAVLKAGVAE